MDVSLDHFVGTAADVLGSFEILVKLVSTVVPVYLVQNESQYTGLRLTYLPEELDKSTLGKDDTRIVPIHHSCYDRERL